MSADLHACRPFYGTVEAEKASLNAMNHLMRAGKELHKLRFTVGNVLPQAKDYQVSSNGY